MDNPFKDPVTGEINFPLRPLRDVIFIWPDSLLERVGSIIIPEFVRDQYKNSSGVVLRTGSGSYVPKHKKWLPTTVKVGDWVLFDKDIPFSMKVTAPDGEKYDCQFMGNWDVQGIIREGSV